MRFNQAIPITCKNTRRNDFPSLAAPGDDLSQHRGQTDDRQIERVRHCEAVMAVAAD